MKVKTVTSLSGGKSSSMMAVEFPTDYYLFSVVLTTDKNAVSKDKGLIREIKKKIPNFEASRELDQTFEELISKIKRLPNRITRICTQLKANLKISKDGNKLNGGNLIYLCIKTKLAT